MTIGFVNPHPAVRPAGNHLIQTLEPIVYNGSGYRIEIPKGFVCDGASVPGFAWALMRSHWIDLMVFGVLHDWCFRTDATIRDGKEIVPVPGWRWSNRECCNALETLGETQKADAWKVRPALAIGSWWSYHKKPVGWSPGTA